MPRDLPDPATSGDFSGGGVTPPAIGNGAPPLKGSMLVGVSLEDMNDLGPVNPGHCDFCGGKLPKGKALYCTPECRRQMDLIYRNFGRQMMQLAGHWVHGTPHKGTALGRMDAIARDVKNRLIETRKAYGLGLHAIDKGR